MRGCIQGVTFGTKRLRTIIGALALALSLSVAVSAVTYIAFEQITVAGASIGFTAAKITPTSGPQATVAVCRIETAELRYTIDGTVPTSTVGTLLEVGDLLTLQGHDVLVLFRAIRTGSSGQVNCTYSAP